MIERTQVFRRRSRGPRPVTAAATLSVLALLLATTAVLAVDPPRISGGITDVSEVIASRAEVLEAQERLFDGTGTQLYAVYLPTTDGEDINGFADRIIAANQGTLTENDALLVVATDDREATLITDAELSDEVSNTELDLVYEQEVKPRLAEDDWAGAAIGAADGLLVAIKGQYSSGTDAGSDGGGISGVVLVLLLVVVAVIGFVVYRAMKARGSQAEADVQEDLGRKASSLLVSTDEALRKADQELGFAEAQFGAEVAKALAGALAGAKEELSAAFKISAALDDETPETPEQRRSMLQEIVARCERANAAVAEQQANIDRLRDLGRNVDTVLPTIEARAAEVDARVAAGRQTLATFASYAQASWQGVAGNADAAAAKVAAARTALAGATATLAAGKRDDAAMGARSAEMALAEADALLKAIDETAVSLKEMSAKMAASLAHVGADLARAETAVASGRSGGGAQELGAARTAFAQAQQLASALPPDIAGAMRLTTEADALLDRVLADQQRAAQAAQQAIALAGTSVAQAQAMASGGLGGRRALTRLNEAQAYLQRANELLATDPAAATQAAQTADALADEALAEAQAERQDSAPIGMPMGFPSGGTQSGGGGGGLGGLLTGIVLGGMLGGGGGNRGSWGGGGTGWGGGHGSGGFGGGSRSGGGMRSGRRSGGGF